jgi:hypothetical protein
MPMPTRKIPGFDWDLTFIFDFVHLIWFSWNAFCGPWHILALTKMKSDYSTNSPFTGRHTLSSCQPNYVRLLGYMTQWRPRPKIINGMLEATLNIYFLKHAEKKSVV